LSINQSAWWRLYRECVGC